MPNYLVDTQDLVNRAADSVAAASNKVDASVGRAAKPQGLTQWINWRSAESAVGHEPWRALRLAKQMSGILTGQLSQCLVLWEWFRLRIL
jgi:hypothetical protein